ncbi:MAG: hypothetical protein H6739_28360 [Alphaproteobacteria bacterium]|nr:hypothetical protein [Alphaproteobacteria bacterium]
MRPALFTLTLAACTTSPTLECPDVRLDDTAPPEAQPADTAPPEPPDRDDDGVPDDEDCDPDDPTVTLPGVWYLDADGDGHGDPRRSTTACVAPVDHVAEATDCDDLIAVRHPDARELCDDLDNDCDGLADEGVLGATESCPATSCAQLLEREGAAPAEAYLREMDGDVAGYACAADGSTVLFDWAATDSSALEDFEAHIAFNNMGVFRITSDGRLEWSDQGHTRDVLAWRLPVEIENDGAVTVEILYQGVSMEESMTFLHARAGGVDEHLLCTTVLNNTPESLWSDAELHWRPYSYCADQNGSIHYTWDNTDTSVDGPVHAQLEARIDEIGFTSFMDSTNSGDQSFLDTLTVRVR